MDNVRHLLDLLDIHRRNASLLVKQRASFGNALVPQHIMSSLNEARGNISRIKQQLTGIDDIPGVDFDIYTDASAAIDDLVARLRELPEDIQREVIEEWDDFLNKLDY